MGEPDALGPGAVEPAGVGLAVSDRLVLAGTPAWAATAQNQRRWGAAADETGTPLAARAPVGVGGRGGFCGRVAGLGLGHTAGGHGLARAVRCGARPSSRVPTSGETWSPTLQGAAPAPRVGLGGARGHALGGCRSGLVWRSAAQFLHRSVVPRRGRGLSAGALRYGGGGALRQRGTVSTSGGM